MGCEIRPSRSTPSIKMRTQFVGKLYNLLCTWELCLSKDWVLGRKAYHENVTICLNCQDLSVITLWKDSVIKLN